MCTGDEKIPMDISTPLTFDDACANEHWARSIQVEIENLRHNKVWDEAILPTNAKAIGSKWVFRVKRDSQGNIVKLKSRLVVKGYRQRYQRDYTETWAGLPRMTTVRMVVALAAAHNLHIHACDVVAAFLQGKIDLDVYLEPPKGIAVGKGKVLRLLKAVYGCKQAPKCWQQTFNEFLLKGLGMRQSKNDSCLFVKHVGGKFVWIICFVDDLIICTNCQNLLKSTKRALADKFKITDEGALSWFLGVKIEKLKDGSLKMSQSQYIRDMVTKFGVSCRAATTPMEFGFKCTESPQLELCTDYKAIIGSLLYCSRLTRPDVSVAVGILARYSSKPTKGAMNAAKRVVRYLATTPNHGIVFAPLTTGSIKLTGWADASWANDIGDRRSTTGFLFSLGNGSPVCWHSKKQGSVALSTAEAEFIAASKAGAEAAWLRRVLDDLGHKQTGPTVLHEDNKACISMSATASHHGRAKHIDIRVHHVKELVARKILVLQYCESGHMIADCLTKPLQRRQFEVLRRKIVQE